MSARDECGRVAEILGRFDGSDEPGAGEMESVATHLESCPDCAVADADRLLAAVRDLDAPLPQEAYFAETADQIMAAVRAEPEAPRRTDEVRRPARVVQMERPARSRRRLVGTALALAAGIALLVTASLVRDRDDTATRVASVEDAVPSAPGDGFDAAALAASDDAWLVASYDLFDLEPADLGSAWAVEDLSDDELDALEGMFGSAPSLG